MKYVEIKALLEEKQRQFKLLQKKIIKGEVAGNGVPQLIKDSLVEISQLKQQLTDSHEKGTH
jgi:hypothetical protein